MVPPTFDDSLPVISRPAGMIPLPITAPTALPAACVVGVQLLVQDEKAPDLRVAERGILREVAVDLVEPREQRERRVVVHFAVPDHAAVAVRGVLVQADVGHHDHVRQLLLHPPHGLLDRGRVVPGLAALVVLPLREAEEDDGPHSDLREIPDLRDRLVGREPEHAGQRPDLLAKVRAVPHEQRSDEAVRREPGLPHQRPEGRGAAKAAETRRRESGHGRNLCSGGVAGKRLGEPGRRLGESGQKSVPRHHEP